MQIPSELNDRLQQARRALEERNDAKALALYAELARKFPRPVIWLEYGRAAATAGDFDLADQMWKKILERERTSSAVMAELAQEYQSIHLHTKARDLYQRAAQLQPESLEAQLSVAWLLARTNSVDEARAALDRCVAIDAANEQVRYLSAHLNLRANRLVEAENQFRDLIAAGPRHPYVGYACRSELAQVLDRTGRHEEAMSCLGQAKAQARPTFGEEAERKNISAWYRDSLAKTRALPKNILDTWRVALSSRSQTGLPAMAFLSGSARSGTTLLEKILDAHPQVAACDEPVAFARLLPLIDFASATVPSQRLDALRTRYVRNFEKSLGASVSGKVLLDKNPSQTAWLPALLRMNPQLRVVIALRDPRDVLVSLYFQNQGRTNGLTFEQLAEYYANVMDLWLAVREWKGLAWIETRYEDTVSSLETEGGRATRFLGLEWHGNQARHYESNCEKPVLSTNYTDVTQPVYARSVGRWRHYEKYLEPVQSALAPYVRIFGYR